MVQPNSIVYDRRHGAVTQFHSVSPALDFSLWFTPTRPVPRLQHYTLHGDTISRIRVTYMYCNLRLSFGPLSSAGQKPTSADRSQRSMY